MIGIVGDSPANNPLSNCISIDNIADFQSNVGLVRLHLIDQSKPPVTALPLELPIDAHLERIVAQMQKHNCLILKHRRERAKPREQPLRYCHWPMLRDVPRTATGFPQGKILLIQPRRIAAARLQLASLPNENAAGTVGRLSSSL